MKLRWWNGWLISVLVIGPLFSGCSLHARMDRGQELISHPQFESAATHAPDFTALALDIIVELEAELERK